MTIQNGGRTELLIWMLLGAHGLTMLGVGFLVGEVARYHASTTDILSQTLSQSEQIMGVYMVVGAVLMGLSAGVIFGPVIRDFVGHVVSGDD